jgi:outer membrane autotransporter protein
LWLGSDAADRAFGSLSGEALASGKTAYIQNAHLLADSMIRRLDAGFDADAEGSVSPVSAYADGPALPAEPSPRNALWGEAYGANARFADTPNTSDMDSSTFGFAGGYDALAGPWRLGLMLHAGTTSTDVRQLASSSDSTDYGIGLYGGTEWGGMRLALGAAYTAHDISSTRNVAIGDSGERVTADYFAGTAQVFARLSRQYLVGRTALTPFADLAYVSHSTGAIDEDGGDAALSSDSGTASAAFTTLGLGFDRTYFIPHGMTLSLKGSLGWRHAFGDDPDATNRFADGDSFTVVGTPIAGDVAAIDAGFDLELSAATALSVFYGGQIGDEVESHAIRGTWTTRF